MVSNSKLTRAIVAAALMAFLSTAGQAQDDDIQKQLSNPIASLTVVPIQTNFDFNIGPLRDGHRITTNIQPVVPFKLSDEMTLVIRPLFLSSARTTSSPAPDRSSV